MATIRICDKCKVEEDTTNLINPSKAICKGNPQKGVEYVIDCIDLCDECRRDLGKEIRKWLYSLE